MGTEKRLIYEEDVLRDKVWVCGGFVSDDFSMGYMEALDKVETVIRNAPTVDAVPAVHGRWEPREDVMGFARCSVCHDCNIYDDWADGKKWSYCPNCAAKMDLEV